MFWVNGRFRSHKVTGMQRYATEVCKRLQSAHNVVHPSRPLKGMAGHLWEQTVLAGVIRSGLLWSPCNTGPLLARRQVLTVHDLIPLEHPEWFNAQFSGFYKSVMPALIRRAIRIVAVSHFTKSRIIELFGTKEQKITVIPNGIGDAFRPQPTNEIDRVARSLGIPEGPYLLSVCSLEPRKNLGRLLAAWSILSKRGVQANLVVAGAKGSSSVFSAAKLGSIPDGVIFTGYVPDEDLPALYSGARAFVYPSLYEGFGLPVLEALAAGTQVITSNKTSIPEVAGPSAILIDPFDVEQLSAAMEKVLHTDYALADQSLGCQHATSYTWDSCAQQTEELLLSCS